MAKGNRLGTAGSRVLLVLLFAACLPLALLGGATTRTNPPSECQAARNTCGCPKKADEGKKDDGTGTYSSCRAAGPCTADGPDVENGCIKIWLDLGRTTPWTGSMACSLKLFADDEASDIFYSESLYPSIGGYTFKRLGQKTMPDGRTPAEVVLNHPRGEPVHFTFRDGGSWGMPDPGVHVEMDERLMMVDAEGWATTSDPVYWDLYAGDGTRRRFLATDKSGRMGSLVSFTDARGVAATPQDMGVDLVYDGADLRQVLTPCRLAHVDYTADWTGYDISVYPLSGKPRFDDARGLYDLPSASPVSRLSVRPGKDGKRAVVTVAKGGGEPQVYTFDYLMGEWSLVRPSGVREEKERFTRDMADARIVKTVKSASKQVLSRRESNFKWESWGFAMTNRVEGFGGVTDTTTWTYYTSGNGKGQVKTELRQSGLLIQYAYDNLDRKISETRSGPDMMTETTTYDYTPVDAGDPVLPVDTRPRTVVKTLDGIECERTYYAYMPLTNIVERVGEQGAAYGGTNALRTVTAFYPVVANDARSGFVASIRHEDGTLDLYDYVLVSNLWTKTVTHLHEQSPSPVSGKTTRDTTITNARGENIETRTEAYIDDAWHVIARERNTYNAEGKIVQRENLAGQVTTATWDCCHKVSETLADGSMTTWDYDDDGHMIASSRLVPLDMTNVTWLTTCYEYDDLGRQVATWQTNYAAQVGLPATRTSYDQLGRVIARIDQLGNTTTTTYSPEGRTESILSPNGATAITTRFADGDTLSITGTAVTPEFHSYGILTDGTRWSRTVEGETANSPRFAKRYKNLLGQTIREERSGFQGAVLATTHTYDAYGRLVSTAADYEPSTEYTYDTFGKRIATTRLVGASVPACPSEWRKTETLSSFVLDDSIIWLTHTNIVSCSDSAIAPLVSSSMRQLAGLNASLPARSRSTDIRGNVTVNETLVNSSIVTSRQTLPYATNKPLSLSRYGVNVMDVSVSAVTNTVAYDALGRQVAHTDGRGNTRHTEYNSFGQRSASIDALGNRTTYAYDQFGNLASVTDPLGNATVYEYDLRGNITYEGGAAYPVRYTYDVFGNKVTMMTYRNESLGPDSGDITTWLYDEASSCMTNKVYADGKGPTYNYSSDGKLSQRTWARGVVTDYSYDGWGNLTNVVYSDDTPTVSIAYDDIGRQIEAHDAVGTTTLTYDAYGSLTNETIIGVAGTNTIKRFWDDFGRTSGYTLNPDNPVNSIQVSYSYDNLDHFSAIEFDSYTEPQVHGEFNYSYLFGTDIVSGYTSGDFARSISYEPHCDLVSAVTNTFGALLISAFAYGNDAVGRRVSRLDSFDVGTTANTFGYNARSEVIDAAMGTNTFGYAYDPSGNRVESSQNSTTNIYSANCLNQCTAISNLCDSVPLCESSLTYDADGNMTSDDRFTYYWNGENHIVCASNAEVVVTYAYDHRGRMKRKEISCRGAEAQSIAYVWDDWNIVREVVRKGDFLAVADNVWGLDIYGTLQGAGGVGGLLAVLRDDGTFLPTYDANGNVTEYVATNGAVTAHYEYSAFGEFIVSNGELVDTFTHQFSTKPYCKIMGFYEYVYRKYLPEIGRWLSFDPIEEGRASPGLYIFCDNDALTKCDYIGLRSLIIVGPFILAPPIVPPERPKECDQPCQCADGNISKGILKCKFVTEKASISGGWENFWNHQMHKWNHAASEDRKQKPECWNPSYCFKAKPTCPEGWSPYGSSFLTDGIKKLINTNPAWNFTTSALDDMCFEMQSREWLKRPTVFLGRWCTKCE